MAHSIPPTHPTMTRPYPWEKSYPPGMKWDVPLRIGTLNELLSEAVAEFGPRALLTYGGRSWTYQAFGDLVDRAAAGLSKLGISQGKPLALFLPNTPWHPVLFFAGLKLGARIVHISPLDAERDIVHKIKDTGARILVTTDVGAMAGAGQKLAAGLGAAGLIDTVIIGEDMYWRQGETCARTPAGDRLVSGASLFDAVPLPASALPAVKPDDVALYQFTGGTTGLPKAALLTHGNLFAAKEIYRVWGDAQGHYEKENGKCLVVLPLFHIYALSAVVTTLIAAGYELILHPRFDTEAVVADIEKHKVTMFPGVPTMWIAIANHPGIEGRDLSSLKRIASGGAPCPVEIEQKIKALTKLPLGGGWGMTETAPAGTNIPTHGILRFGTIGVPLPGILMDIVALDDPKKILGVGEVGEIRIKGPNVIAGYHNRGEENAKAFADGYLLTGDMGRMDADGYFEIVDRKKDMIISGGFNVYPRHIEEAMYEHPSVAEVIVIGVADSYRGEAAKAFVTLKPGAKEFSLDELKAFLADKVAKYEMPAHLEFRAVLPRTPVGKLSKKELVAEERAKAAKG
jgi:long-chain acyl-CoA synthetase